MNAKHIPEGRPSRRCFYIALALAAPALAGLLWMAWQAMCLANPWFSGFGLAATAAYLIAVHRHRARPQLELPFIGEDLVANPGQCRKPILRLVKK